MSFDVFFWLSVLNGVISFVVGFFIGRALWQFKRRR